MSEAIKATIARSILWSALWSARRDTDHSTARRKERRSGRSHVDQRPAVRKHVPGLYPSGGMVFPRNKRAQPKLLFADLQDPPWRAGSQEFRLNERRPKWVLCRAASKSHAARRFVFIRRAVEIGTDRWPG